MPDQAIGMQKRGMENRDWLDNLQNLASGLILDTPSATLLSLG